MIFSEDAELETHGLLMVGVEIPTDIAHDSDEMGELELEDTKVIVGTDRLLIVISFEAKNGEIHLGPHT